MIATATNTGKPNLLTRLKTYFNKLSAKEKICYLLLGVILLLVYSIRLKFLSIPFERDEGAYAYYGRQILDGKIPYKDFYEQKLPGIFYFYALIVSLFGSTIQGLHLGFIFINLISIIFIFAAAKNLYSPFAAIISAITFAVVSLSPGLSGFTIQSEHGVALFATMGLFFYSLVNKSNKKYQIYLMGLFLGLAFITKTSGIFIAFAGGLIILVDGYFKKISIFKIIINALVYTAGIITILFIFLLLVYSKGSFNDMIFWVYELPKYYVGKIPFEQGKEYCKAMYQMITTNYKFFWMQAFIAIPLFLVKSIELKHKIVAFIFGLFSFLTIVPGYYFYGHYWIQMIPALALLSGLTFYLITTIIKNRFKITSKYIPYAYLVIVLIVVFNHLNSLKYYYYHPNYERVLRSVYGGNPFPESAEIANFINSVSKPTDDLLIIGSEPQIYIYTNKKSPTRHIFFSTIVANLPQHKEWQREFVRDAEKAKPKFLLFFNIPVSLLRQPDTDNYVFEWANKYIAENYKVLGIVEMADGQMSTYTWKEAALNYQPKTQNYILLFERKTP